MEQTKYFLAGRTMKTSLTHKILHDTIFDMENKYYKPKLKEFHVGFEYELRSNVYPVDEFWRFPVKKMKFTETTCKDINTLNRFALDLHDGDIRVKFLDEVDLKDLGWKKLDKSGHELSYGATTYLIDNSTEFPNITDKWFLTTYLQGMTIDIRRERMSSYGDSLDKHSFRIKNKAELRRLMYQLEIIE